MGGLIEREPHVRIVFWGSNWNAEGNLALKGKLLSYYESLSGSAEQGVLTQYFDAEGHITQHVSVAAMTDTRVAAPANVNEAALEPEVQWAESQLGTHAPETQTVLLLAPGSTYNAKFASGYCAYHDITREGAVYSFVPYAGDEPFKGENYCTYYGRGDAGRATMVMASHEYAEVVTDPYWDTQPGWRTLETSQGELGDLCATMGDEITGGYYVQGWYDDHENRCSESDPNPPSLFAATEDASEVTQTTAELNATVNPESQATTYYWEYGPTESYGNRIPTSGVYTLASASQANDSLNTPLSNLSTYQIVHYRICAVNATGVTCGEDRTITPSNWALQTPAQTAVYGENWLNTVACSSESFCLAGGYAYRPKLNPSNVAISFALNANTWTSVPVHVKEGERDPELSATCTAATDTGEAVGSAYTGGHENAIAETYADGSWTQQNLPASESTMNWLEGVSCISKDEYIAVGGAGPARNVEEQPYAVIGKDGVFTKLALPQPPNTVVASLRAISCTSTAFCMAVGTDWKSGGEIRPWTATWNGSVWALKQTTRVEDSGENEVGTLSGVSCTSPTFCVAVGRHHWRQIIEEWNGTSWSLMTSPALVDAASGALRSVSCVAPTDCKATGYGYSEVAEANEPSVALVETWNGTAWAEEVTTRENERVFSELDSVSCVNIQTCVTAGWELHNHDTSLLETHNWAKLDGEVHEPPVVGDTNVGTITPTTTTLTSTITLNGLPATSCIVEYGTSRSHGEIAPCTALPAGDGTITATLTGLKPNTHYYYARFAVANAEGSAVGDEVVIVTPPPSPTTETGEATNIGETTAMIGGSVNMHSGGEASCHVEYGESTAYGSTMPCSPTLSVSSTATQVSTELRNLTKATTYHYRIEASNVGGTTRGEDKAFTTKGAVAPPTPESPPPSEPTPVLESPPVFPIGRTEPPGRASLAITQHVKVKTAHHRLILTVAVLDRSQAPAEKVEVCDVLPQGTKYVSASRKAKRRGSTLCFSLGDLDTWSKVGTITIYLSLDYKVHGALTNSVTAKATNAATLQSAYRVR